MIDSVGDDPIERPICMSGISTDMNNDDISKCLTTPCEEDIAKIVMCTDHDMTRRVNKGHSFNTQWMSNETDEWYGTNMNNIPTPNQQLLPNEKQQLKTMYTNTMYKNEVKKGITDIIDNVI